MEYNVVIDGYKINRKNQRVKNDKSVEDIEVIYLSGNEFFTQSRYSDVPSEKIEKVMYILSDHTDYNKTAETCCQRLGLISIIHDVEDEIFATK